MKEVALNRDKWRGYMEGQGMDLAIAQWMQDNRVRRARRMNRKGTSPIDCDIVEGMDFMGGEGMIRELRSRKIVVEREIEIDELDELFPGRYLRRSPLEIDPITRKPNLIAKLGKRVATEIFEYYETLMKGEQRRLDPFETWEKPINKIWMEEFEKMGMKAECLKRWRDQDFMEEKRRHRDNVIQEWFLTSNVWDPIRNQNEVFEIEDIMSFKKIGRKGYFLVVYAPRTLAADIEFPIEFPEVKGKPWPLKDWIATSELTPRIRGDKVLLNKKTKVVNWYNLLEEIKKRGRTVAVDGVIEIVDD